MPRIHYPLECFFRVTVDWARLMVRRCLISRAGQVSKPSPPRRMIGVENHLERHHPDRHQRWRATAGSACQRNAKAQPKHSPPVDPWHPAFSHLWHAAYGEAAPPTQNPRPNPTHPRPHHPTAETRASDRKTIACPNPSHPGTSETIRPRHAPGKDARRKTRIRDHIGGLSRHANESLVAASL